MDFALSSITCGVTSQFQTFLCYLPDSFSESFVDALVTQSTAVLRASRFYDTIFSASLCVLACNLEEADCYLILEA
jgi:hypothetical protein